MGDLLLSFARAVLGSVMDTITSQLNVVESQVLQVLEGFVKQVVGGAWQGPDADAFVSKVNTLLPKISNSHQQTSNFLKGISQAADQIVQTDQQAESQVGDLINTFSSIY